MKPVILLLIFVSISFNSSTVLADQQTDKDAGESHARSLIDGVRNLSQTSDVNQIPGYGGTNLPEAEYYNNQDVGGLQTDAVVGVTTGTVSDAALFGYNESTKPKLQFNPTDPIILNSTSIADDAVLNPDVLTVPTGDCAISNVTSQDKRIEHCTAWYTPSHHVCNQTLDVQVRWNDNSNCAVGQGYSTVQQLHNTAGRDDYVYGRAYCNHGLPDGQVAMQAYASDGDNDCTGWTSFNASTSQPQTYTGLTLRPRFRDSCTDVPVFAAGSCGSVNCNYTLTYYELGAWEGRADDRTCSGPVVNLTALGFTGGSISNGLTCTRRFTSLDLAFVKPEITREPIVTESWVEGCQHLEAQVQP